MKLTFPLKESVSFAFKKIWNNFGKILLIGSLYFLLLLLFLSVTLFFFYLAIELLKISSLKFVGRILIGFTLLNLVVLSSISLGIKQTMLDIYDNKSFSLKRFFPSLKKGFRNFSALVLRHIIVYIGTLFLLIPGLIFAGRLIFFPYFIIDKNTTVLEAFEHSIKLTENLSFSSMFFYIFILLIDMLGNLTIIGMIVTKPIVELSIAAAYRKLLEQKTSVTNIKTEIRYIV